MITKLKSIRTPISEEVIKSLKIGDMIELSGPIYTGRDAALPRLVELVQSGKLDEEGINLQGAVIFHTAVSPAGVGPTSSNKFDIETTIPALSEAGVKIHIGKGRLGEDTVSALESNSSIYAVTPPVTALLESKIISRRVVAFPEEGMEAFHLLMVKNFPCVVASAGGLTLNVE